MEACICIYLSFLLSCTAFGRMCVLLTSIPSHLPLDRRSVNLLQFRSTLLSFCLRISSVHWLAARRRYSGSRFSRTQEELRNAFCAFPASSSYFKQERILPLMDFSPLTPWHSSLEFQKSELNVRKTARVNSTYGAAALASLGLFYTAGRA